MFLLDIIETSASEGGLAWVTIVAVTARGAARSPGDRVVLRLHAWVPHTWARPLLTSVTRHFMSSKMSRVPSVYDYLDFRSFLNDHIAYRKQRRAGFSQRQFAAMAGFRSPSYVKMVLDGKRNIKPATALDLAKACQLDLDGSRYFETLVRMNQAQSTQERDTYFRQLGGFRHYRQAHRLEIAHSAYYSEWYIPAVYELSEHTSFVHDPDWIRRKLMPPISKAQAQRALDVLHELGFFQRSQDGTVVRAHAVLSTGPELRTMHVANYHRAMITLAGESIDNVPSAERDISSLTLCLGEEELQSIKNRIRAFRQELLEIAEGATRKERIVQVNFQLFPLSQK